MCQNISAKMKQMWKISVLNYCICAKQMCQNICAKGRIQKYVLKDMSQNIWAKIKMPIFCLKTGAELFVLKDNSQIICTQKY